MNIYKISRCAKATLLALSLIASSHLAFAQAKSTGTITSMDLQNRTMEIDKHPFMLADKMLVFSPNNALTSQAGLSIGQKVDYWFTTGEDSTQKVITKTQILSQYDDKIKK